MNTKNFNPYQVEGAAIAANEPRSMNAGFVTRFVRFAIPTVGCAFANEAAVFWGVSEFEYWSQRAYLPTSAVLCAAVAFACLPFITWAAFANPLRSLNRQFYTLPALLVPSTCLYWLLKARILPSPEMWILRYCVVTIALQYGLSALLNTYTDRSRYVAALPSIPCFGLGAAAGVFHVVTHSLSDP